MYVYVSSDTESRGSNSLASEAWSVAKSIALLVFVCPCFCPSGFNSLPCLVVASGHPQRHI